MTMPTLINQTHKHERHANGASATRQPNGAAPIPRQHRPRGPQRADQQPVLSTRGRVDERDAGRFIHDSLADIHGYMLEQHIRPSGPPFARCRPTGASIVDIETGWPLERPAEGRGRIHGGSLPAMLINHATPRQQRADEPPDIRR